MCVAVPGRVLEIAGPGRLLAKVDLAGVSRTVNLGLLEDPGEVNVGDYVIVHLGFAIEQVPVGEAEEMLRTLSADLPSGTES